MSKSEHDVDGRVAVIGMAGRFPGAPDLDTFWTNLRDGVESIRPLSEDELLLAGETVDEIRQPSYVRAAAPLADVDKFDAAFFGMSPRDASVFDPQHRLFLECAWEAFENAGYIGSGIDGSVGVFASCGLSEYMFKNVLANARVKESVGEWLIRHTGNDTNFLATRVSYEMDLHGPSMNVQTACSSTLVAIHLACQSLLSGECDVALAGGAVVSPNQVRGYHYKPGEILSPDGHCRAFDAESAGTVISSAAGCVLLKPLADALEDGDTILAVVRGSAINNDGRDKVGYLAPSVGGQAQAVSEALAVAGVDPRDVSYVEMHGTGTLIGDPIEVAGLTEAFRQHTEDRQFCAIGSLKTNIGHTGEASGVAAFIKTVLSLVNEEIPPNLHFHTPNPQAELPASPFFVNDRLRPWPSTPSSPRLAGITSLGAGGTNAHIIVEEAPPAAVGDEARPEQLVVISARTKKGLERAATDLAAHLRRHPDTDLADVAFTRLAGRAAFRHRRAVVASTPEEAAEALESNDPRTIITGDHTGDAPSVVFMMPGGGAQYVGMGAGLYETEPVFTDAIDACNDVLVRKHGIDIVDVLFSTEPSDVRDKQLQSPSLALPALFAIGYAMAILLESWDIAPAAMIGHSAGEYVVACLSGVITMEQGLDLVATRGRLFETLPTGRMLSVSLDETDLRARMADGLSVAVVNASKLCVVSGPDALIAEMEHDLERDEIDCMRIPIDVAAHSAMLDPILDDFRAFCRTVPFKAPTVPYVSNLTGDWITAAQTTDPEYWVRHLRETVRFADGLSTILNDANRVLIEIGPGRTLTGLARSATPKPAGVTPTLRHVKDDVSDVAFVLATLGRIWCSGTPLEIDALFADQHRRRIPLPTYPFDRQSYWVDPDPTSATARPASTELHKLADVAQWFSAPSWHRTVTPAPTDPVDAPLNWLLIAEDSTLAEAVRNVLVELNQRIITVAFANGFGNPDPGRFTVEPSRSQDWAELVDRLGATDGLPDRIIHMTAVGPSRGRRLLGIGRDDQFASFEQTVRRDHASVLMLARALSSRSAPMRLGVVTSGVHSVAGERADHVERALLHGTSRVIPRELSNVRTVSVDVDDAAITDPRLKSGIRSGTRHDTTRSTAAQIVAEIRSDPGSELAVLRNGQRWTRAYNPVPLPSTTTTPWRSGATYLITGGLGGIGLAIAEHIAQTARGATVELVGRTALPPESDWANVVASPLTSQRQRQQIEAVLRMRRCGARVVFHAADVTDLVAMRRIVAESRARNGRIVGVVHAAGVLQDALIALRTPVAMSPVVEIKVKGTLVLDDVLADEPPEFVVLCSSVSSIIGLPGQADYTAANAFLDAYAAARSIRNAERGATRYISVNWSAWQDVGMAVDAVDAAVGRSPANTFASEPELVASRVRDAKPDGRPGRPTSSLLEQIVDDGIKVTGTTNFARSTHWLLDEHVVRDGKALIPGTGHLELLREVAAVGISPGSGIELSDVVFVDPFIVGDDEVRALRVEFDRSTGAVEIHSDAATGPHVTADAVVLDDGRTGDRIQHDLAEIARRCTVRREVFEDGFPVQEFMAFGPRWGNLRSIEYGQAEALVTVEMPAAFVGELADLWLHPALLDMLTGNAQALIPGFSSSETFYVPFSYGRVLTRGPLPSHAISHLRLRQATRGTAVFDISIMASDGTEVVAIEGFTMRLVSSESAILPVPSDHAPRGTLPTNQRETPIEAAVREGIRPVEGIDALDRILLNDLGPQVVVSAVDLETWIAKVDAEATVDPDQPPSSGPQFERPDMGTEFEAPATPIEGELAVLWQDLLGVQRVGRNDDFFELGGQSLIAVRLFTRIRKMYSIDLPLTTLFEGSTIAAIAVVVSRSLGVDKHAGIGETVADESGPTVAHGPVTASRVGEGLSTIPTASRSLVSISAGGPGTPLFMVHGAGGNVLFLWTLARALARDRPVYGFQAMGVNPQDRPDTTLEQMAERYVDELTRSHPGPYLLGGYSGGGIVTLEMSRLLQERGHEVLQALLFDSVPPRRPLPSNLRRMINVARNARRGGFAAVAPRYSLVKVRRYATRLLPTLATRAAHDDAAADHALGYDELDGYVDLYDHFSEVADRYDAGVFDVGVTLFKADQIAPILPDDYYWGQHVAGSLELRFVHGDHHSMFYPEFLPRLAETVRARLFELEAERTAVVDPSMAPEV